MPTSGLESQSFNLLERSFVISRSRIIVVLDTLPVCIAVGIIAAWRSSYAPFSASVFLTGAVFASPVFWRGRWSCSFVTRTALTAYLLRCVAFYVVGTNASKIAALGDAGIGLAAFGGAYIMRRAIHKYTARGTWTASQQLVREGCTTTHRCCDSEEVGEGTNATATSSHEETPNWSPPQFSLKAVFVFSFGWAALLAVAVTGGFVFVRLMIVLGLLLWITAGCVRLVLLGTNDDPAEKGA